METTYKIGAGLNVLRGYIYNQNDRYSPAITIPLEEKQIASFLVRTSGAKKVVFTNFGDEMEIETMPNSNGFLDYCADQEYLREKLLPVLIPMQQGIEKPEEIKVIDWGTSEETLQQMGEEGIKNWLNETFQTKL